MTGPTSSGLPAGDELLPDANLTLDHLYHLPAAAEIVWPWLIQLGKRRAGWYLPRSLENLIPRRHRALWTLDPELQQLAIGDRIPDYGGRDEWLEVARLQPPHTLVFRSQRRGRQFTWALLLADNGPNRCTLRLRFRGQLRSQGLRLRALSAVAWFFDRLTGELMVGGLRDRLRDAVATTSAPAVR